MCEKCNDTGWIKYISDGYEYVRECDCHKKQRVIDNAKNSGLGDLLNIYSFDSFRTDMGFQKTLYEKAKTFLSETDNKWFTVLGKTGCGKSHICTAICKEMIDRGYVVKFMSWIDDSRTLKANLYERDYGEIVEPYKNAEVLYIDDFFKNEPTSADIRLANEILNYRYNKARTAKDRMITIISSEKPINTLIEIDKAIAGRVVEMSGNYLVLLKDAVNYRLKKYL